MTALIPAAGLLFVCLAAFMAVSECKRILIGARGELSSLRPMAISWLATFGLLLIATLLLKLPALYIATGALIVIAWIAIPSAVYIAWKIRRDGPIGR